MTELKAGRKLGDWQLLERIGAGGNGVVWRVAKGDSEAALKTISEVAPRHRDRLQRFCDEIRTMEACQDIDGVFPLIDYHLPANPSNKNRPWFVMPLATEMTGEIGSNLDLRKAVSACAEIARTLSAMHARGVSHRDIKPQNLFYLGGRWYVGDFGLASRPDKAEITKANRRLGPVYYIAPEMLNSPDLADGASADVFSFAKLLWKLCTGQTYPFPGEHRGGEPITSIATFVQHPKARELDTLIERSTSLDPRRRISMDALRRELDLWLSSPPQAASDSEIPNLSDLSEDFWKLSDRDTTANIKQVVERREAIQIMARQALSRFSPLMQKLARACKEINPDNASEQTQTNASQIPEALELPAAGRPYEVFNNGFYTRLKPSCSIQSLIGLYGGVSLVCSIVRGAHGQQELDEANWIAGAYFYIQDPNRRGDESTIPVWHKTERIVLGSSSETVVLNAFEAQILDRFRSSLMEFRDYVLKTYSSG